MITYKNSIITNISEMEEHLLGIDWLTVRSARHEYFMSKRDMSYSYGKHKGVDISYESNPFTPLVESLLDSLNGDNLNYNACFLNKYDNEQQHLGWHADDFEGMDQSHPIAVVSIGAEREIWVKKKDEKGLVPKDQRFLLENGSLFVMPSGFQDTHLHKIPKHSAVCGHRISMTFRSFKD